jgi:hypothetical protein
MPCACGQTARYIERRGKTFESALGALTLKRAYYHCGACNSGFCPRDRALRLEGATLSPAVWRMVGQVGTMVSFQEGHGLLHDLAGVEVSAKQVERYAEALGRESPRRSGAGWSRSLRPGRRCIWGWTAPACRCARTNWLALPANNPTVRPKHAR